MVHRTSSIFLASLFFLCLFATAMLTPAIAGELLLAQAPPQGQQGQQRPSGQGGGMMPSGGGQGGMGQQGGSNDGCMQSYQRCVMVCAGVANCINNCNMGYAMCTKQQQGGGNGPRPGGK